MRTGELAIDSTEAPARASTPSGFGDRLRASGVHLLISLSVAAAVLLLVYGYWYRAPLDRVSGVGEILLLLLAVDCTLGPVLTFVVFNRAKKSLPFDLAMIAVLQLSALAYGLHTLDAGRPLYLAFVKDRFELVARADLEPEDLRAGASNPQARIDWFGPRVVAVTMPSDAARREAIMLESVAGGRDVQHFPDLYAPYQSQREQALSRALPLERLRTIDPASSARIDAALASAGRAADTVRFLPARGRQADAAVLIDAQSAEVVAIVEASPWR
ncbi:MAG: TfpX/TfpZ family type IV pilin accessory protein [Lautropia sp.]